MHLIFTVAGISFQLHLQFESSRELGKCQQTEVMEEFSNSRAVEVYSQFGTINTKKGSLLDKLAHKMSAGGLAHPQ